MTTVLAFVGRVMIALLFLVSGANKLVDVSGTDAMIRSVGLPGGLGLATGLFEVVAGIALVFGFATRFTAILLAGFCLVTAFFFHNAIADPMQAAMLLKNVAIAGGLLGIAALDTVRWSYDAMRARRRAELAELRAEHRAHDAELRAARAEGAAVARDDHAGHAVVHEDGTVTRRRWWPF